MLEEPEITSEATEDVLQHCTESPYKCVDGNLSSFIIRHSSPESHFRSVHPLPSEVSLYWHVYKENVDPLTKLVHVPTVEKTMMEIINSQHSLRPSTGKFCYSLVLPYIV